MLFLPSLFLLACILAPIEQLRQDGKSNLLKGVKSTLEEKQIAPVCAVLKPNEHISRAELVVIQRLKNLH
jgi:hypothetical protein